MWYSSWLRDRIGSRKHRPVSRFRPTLEVLEGRWVPSTLTVTNNLNGGIGSLRAEIAAAKSGDTIVFAPSLNGQTITLTSGELLINKNLTINGPGAGELTVSGNNASRVFDLLNVIASVSGMTMRGGNAYVGAAIANQSGGSLTIDNCVITGNSATYQGGGIYNTGALSVSNCSLTGNSASSSGGAIYDYAASFTVQVSTISGNRARVDGGGIGFFSTSTSQVGTIQSCTVANNSASHGGGVNSHGTLKLLGSNLSGNTAAEDGTVYGTLGARGGGLYNWGTVTVTDCTFTGNSAALGGGIYMSAGSNRTIAGSTFTNNTAVQGGGIYHDSGPAITVSNSSFTGNSAAQGGGIYNAFGYVTLVSCNLSGNSATDSGGGVFNAVSCDLILHGSTLLNNLAPLGADLYNLGTVSSDSASTVGVIYP
jgi:predicted outer membrane repeat protein